MVKKIIPAALAVLTALSLCACGRKAPVAEKGAVGIESQESLDLQYALPEYEYSSLSEEIFDEETEQYQFYAAMTAEEYEKYVKKCKKAGFENVITEQEGIFNAYSEEGKEIYLTYSENDSQVFVLVYEAQNQYPSVKK